MGICQSTTKEQGSSRLGSVGALSQQSFVFAAADYLGFAKYSGDNVKQGGAGEDRSSAIAVAR